MLKQWQNLISLMGNNKRRHTKFFHTNLRITIFFSDIRAKNNFKKSDTIKSRHKKLYLKKFVVWSKVKKNATIRTQTEQGALCTMLYHIEMHCFNFYKVNRTSKTQSKYVAAADQQIFESMAAFLLIHSQQVLPTSFLIK